MLGEQLEVYEAPQRTLHINMLVTRIKTFSQHRRMNLQHAVQDLLNVSLARLHMNIPAGTRGLTPTLAYFDIVLAHTIRTKSQKNMFIRICGRWKRSHYICINSECLCSLTNALPRTIE